MHRRTLACALLLLGCSGSDREAQPVAVPTALVVSPPSAEPPPPVEVAPVAPRPIERSQIDALHAARRLYREGRYADAHAAMTELVERSPLSPRRRCEAGLFAFRAGELEKAELQLDRGISLFDPRGLVDESVRNSLAMCLYNRGLLHEARGERVQAAAVWERSLTLRPNQTVVERYARLGVTSSAGSPPEPADYEVREAPPPRSIPIGRDRASTVTTIHDETCRLYHAHIEDESDFIACDTSIARTARSGPVAAHVVTTNAVLYEGLCNSSSYDVVLERDGVVVALLPLAVMDDVGGYTDATLTLHSFELVQLIPGGAEELRIQFETRDADYEDEEMSTETTHVVVCEIERDTPRCARVPIATVEVIPEWATAHGGRPAGTYRSQAEVTWDPASGAATIRRSLDPECAPDGRSEIRRWIENDECAVSLYR